MIITLTVLVLKLATLEPPQRVSMVLPFRYSAVL